MKWFADQDMSESGVILNNSDTMATDGHMMEYSLKSQLKSAYKQMGMPRNPSVVGF